MSISPFTIFLPVRNGGRYVHEAVASIVAQTDPDWRLIVFENASTDDTVAIVTSFDDPRITIIPAPRPLDIWENWHRPLEWLAGADRGDPLVTFIGHDDLLYPHFVAEAKALAAHAPDATLYQTLFDLIDADGAIIRPCKPVPQHETWLDFAAALAWNFRDSVGTGYFCRAADYVAVGGMPRLPGILYADHLLWLRLTRRGFKLSGGSHACAYRYHADSTSNALSIRGVNDRTEAFAGFIDLLMSDFADLLKSDMGNAAAQVWLGRELNVWDAPAVRRVLTPGNRARVDALRHRLEGIGGKANPRHWSYQAQPVPLRWLRTVRQEWRFGLMRLRRG